jgi:hypothetical protein
MAKSKTYTGINIQYPISRLIVEGKKTIETRTYPLPERLKGQELLIIETPGREGKFKARIIGKIIFADSFAYKSEKDFYKDSKKHCVTPDSIWKWTIEKPKWGWLIFKVVKLKKAIPVQKRTGIVYSKDITLD